MTRKKILVVDDSGTARMMEQMILQVDDYAIVCAHDGLEGVAMAASEHPDLILMDAVMPGLDGYQAVRRIRERDATTPIIMVTTRTEGTSVELGYRSGCSDYLTKPVDALELLTKVRSCLEPA